MDSSPSSEVPARNWLELPEDVMSTILLKVGAIDILCNVQNVCSSWRKICKDPILWRIVDFHNLRNWFDTVYDWEMLCMQAVDYSCGQLLDINIEYFGTDNLLLYISQRYILLANMCDKCVMKLKTNFLGCKRYVSEHLQIYCAERIKNLWFPRDPFDDSETLVELFGYCSDTSYDIYPFTDFSDNDDDDY